VCIERCKHGSEGGVGKRASAPRPAPTHLEDQLKVRPTHGFIVCGDGARHRVENTEELRAWVLGLADYIREARKNMAVPIQVTPKPGQCRSCGMRGHCGQARI
jgi:CRISPR-associated exonuclease Cas4